LVFFDVEVGDFEVLSEELEGETEEGLILGASVYRYGELGREEGRTRMR
jgi:hypothetical protein